MKFINRLIILFSSVITISYSYANYEFSPSEAITPAQECASNWDENFYLIGSEMKLRIEVEQDGNFYGIVEKEHYGRDEDIYFICSCLDGGVVCG